MHTIQQPDYFMHAPALKYNYLLCGPLFGWTLTIHGQRTWNMNMLVHDDDDMLVVVFATCRSIPPHLPYVVAQEAWRKNFIFSIIGVCASKRAIIFSTELLLFGHWEMSPRVHMPPITKGPCCDLPCIFMQHHSAVFFSFSFFSFEDLMSLPFCPAPHAFRHRLVLNRDYPMGVFPMVD